MTTTDTPAGLDTATSTNGHEGISAPMVAALEGAWAAIRARHPEVPAWSSDAVAQRLGSGVGEGVVGAEQP
jgi:hypothetical protein